MSLWARHLLSEVADALAAQKWYFDGKGSRARAIFSRTDRRFRLARLSFTFELTSVSSLFDETLFRRALEPFFFDFLTRVLSCSFQPTITPNTVWKYLKPLKPSAVKENYVDTYEIIDRYGTHTDVICSRRWGIWKSELDMSRFSSFGNAIEKNGYNKAGLCCTRGTRRKVWIPTGILTEHSSPTLVKKSYCIRTKSYQENVEISDHEQQECEALATTRLAGS